MIPLWTAMSASESRPSRFRSVSVSLAGVVGVLAAVVAGAIAGWVGSREIPR